MVRALYARPLTSGIRGWPAGGSARSAGRVSRPGRRWRGLALRRSAHLRGSTGIRRVPGLAPSLPTSLPRTGTPRARRRSARRIRRRRRRVPGRSAARAPGQPPAPPRLPPIEPSTPPRAPWPGRPPPAPGPGSWPREPRRRSRPTLARGSRELLAHRGGGLQTDLRRKEHTGQRDRDACAVVDGHLDRLAHTSGSDHGHLDPRRIEAGRGIERRHTNGTVMRINRSLSRARSGRLHEEQLITGEQSDLDERNAEQEQDRENEGELNNRRATFAPSFGGAIVHSPPPGR